MDFLMFKRESHYNVLAIAIFGERI